MALSKKKLSNQKQLKNYAYDDVTRTENCYYLYYYQLIQNKSHKLTKNV